MSQVVLSKADKRLVLALAKYALRSVLEGRFPGNYILITRRREASIVFVRDALMGDTCCVELDASFFLRPFGAARSDKAHNAVASVHIEADEGSRLKNVVGAVVLLDGVHWCSFVSSGDAWESDEEIDLNNDGAYMSPET
ncbi:MAG: hypothetical protein HGB08_03790 [Candidatus Moranbacteria bacterium]|nr:hypothetical protein [Candidatus Moranbacteria bacterium]